VQSERGVVHIIAKRIIDFSPLLAKLSSTDFTMTTIAADEASRPVEMDSRKHPRNIRHKLNYEPAMSVMPKGRNFH
jgi:error-prone DNA polymerase